MDNQFPPPIRHQRAFTLVELLVVVAIIGLLATLIDFQINLAQMKARDAVRISNARTIQTALGLFKSGNDRYPWSSGCQVSGTIPSPNAGWCNSVQSVVNNHWIRDATGNLSQYLPQDPGSPQNKTIAQLNADMTSHGCDGTSVMCFSSNVFYYFASDYGSALPYSQWYMIVFYLELPSGVPPGTGVTAPDGTHFDYRSSANPNIVTWGSSS